MQDSEDPLAPEFWFKYLMNKFDEEIEQSERLANWTAAPKNRRERLQLLRDYVTGNPPLPYISDKYKTIFQQVMRKARTNYALLVIEAMTDRSKVASVSTEIDADFDGDDFARRVHDACGFGALHSDLQTNLFTYGEAYAQVVPPAEGLDPTDTPPLITVEDPRYCIGVDDPLRPNRLRAWIKLYTDDLLKQQVAIMYWNNTKYIARREPEQYSESFNIDEWEWSTVEGENSVVMEYLTAFGGVPVVKFKNKYDMGEFEPHIDVLDRIVDAVLQRIVIQWYQSFRQRAVTGDLDGGEDHTDDDDSDSLIRSMHEGDDTLKNLFEADPGSLWLLPEGVTFWESGNTDFTPLAKAIEDDVKAFASVSRTPLTMFNPDGANQTAEGATTMKESHLDKVRDRQSRQTPGLILLHQIAFAMGGEESRTVNVRLLWSNIDRTSLQVKGDFIGKVKGTMSRKRMLTHIMEFSSDEVRLNEAELMQEAMMASTLAVTAEPTGEGAAAAPADDSAAAAEPAEDDDNAGDE